MSRYVSIAAFLVPVLTINCGSSQPCPREPAPTVAVESEATDCPGDAEAPIPARTSPSLDGGGLTVGPIGPDAPLCGVLSEAGYRVPDETDREQLAFLVPVGPSDPQVARFVVLNETGHVAPLVVYTDWWFCVTEGELIALPGNDGRYGVVQATGFQIDQSTGERGQE